MRKTITWPQVAMVAVVVIPGCLLVYGLVLAGQTIAGIAAGVGAVLAMLGWQHSNTKAALDALRGNVEKVEKQTNGNLTRAEAARAETQQLANAQLHAVYQQMLQLAAAAPSGTFVPPPPIPLPRMSDVDTVTLPAVDESADARTG